MSPGRPICCVPLHHCKRALRFVLPRRPGRNQCSPLRRGGPSRNGNRSRPGLNASCSRPTRRGTGSACWYASSTTLHDREDAIVALRRAIDRRIRHLNEVYRFRTIPGVNRKAKLIDILKDLRIAHPIMLGKLARLRNLIEHNDGTPLDHEICEELVEFSWYFIKSTDQIVRHRLDSFELFQQGHNHLDEDQYGVEISIGPNTDWIIKFVGNLPCTLLSNEKIPDWIELEVSLPIIVVQNKAHPAVPG